MKKIIFVWIAACFAWGFTACEGDGDADYGFGKIYMPQAVSTGGLDNSYAVPAGGGEHTANYRIENGTLRVILGVTRSGKLSDNGGYSVDVYASSDAATAAAFGGMPMPADGYSVPEIVRVPSGSYNAAFYLDIPAATLQNADYADKKLVLTVGVRNPSAYELAETGTETAVVVDVDAAKALF